jgi:hypothetical protein
MSGGESSHDALMQEVPTAFQRWTRTVFGAPRHPQDLITDVQARDEIIDRLATLVTRREIRAVRTGTRERRSTASRLDPSTVDPFAYTSETLRVESQYIAQCRACMASGMMRCDACGGGCTVVCRYCGGSGKQRSEKTGRPINCKICKKSGRVPCGTCTATGNVSCRTCSGSGHQLAWLAFEESEQWQVTVSPQHSPIVLAHPALAEARPLSSDELSMFSIVESQYSQGPIEPRGLGEPYRPAPQARGVAIDSRLERIRAQQYLRLAIVRRDVTYEMCGTTGTVVLSGKALLGATTPEAVHPIRQRLYAWISLVGLVGVLGVLLRAGCVGSSTYFEGAAQWSAILVAAAVACAVPAFGALLRAWRGGARFRRVARPVLASTGVVALALVGVMVVGLVVRPSASELQAALASGDVTRARIIVEALKERTAGGGLLDLEDRVLLAEAGKQIGQERLKLLDQVARRKGAASAEAATAARNERLSQVRNLVRAKDARAALAALEEWFREDRSVEVSEERARAHEVHAGACKTDTCRLVAAANANKARETDDRLAQVKSYRAKVWDSLATEQVSEKPVVPRLQQVHQLVERASDALDTVASDPEIVARATAAITFGQAEQRKVPLLGMDLAVAKELLGPAKLTANGVPMFSVGGIAVYAAVDQTGRCTGLFAIGDSPSNRALKSDSWSADRILSQALGRPATIKRSNGPTSQWYEGGVPVVVRWREGEIMELRVGNATP